MALIRIDHSPKSIGLNLPLIIILPDSGRIKEMPLPERKVLYLLHGLGDDASAWQRYTSIETLACAYDLVVVMPSAGRSFYTDLPTGQKYFTYLTEELPDYLADLFGLCPRREDTLIAGNSMGGYGAIKAALLHPERYAAAASLSGMLSLAVLQFIPADDPRKDEFAVLFGDLNKVMGSCHDPAVWLQQASKDPANLPRLFIYTGRQEDIYPLSGMFHQACQSLGVQSEYFEEDGGHDWFLWDKHIRLFLASVLGPMAR